MKNKWWCVVTTIDNRGNMASNIVDTVCQEYKPDNTFRSTPRKDIYADWFSSKEMAEEYIERSASCFGAY